MWCGVSGGGGRYDLEGGEYTLAGVVFCGGK